MVFAVAGSPISSRDLVIINELEIEDLVPAAFEGRFLLLGIGPAKASEGTEQYGK
jgi:hypothetical protein